MLEAEPPDTARSEMEVGGNSCSASAARGGRTAAISAVARGIVQAFLGPPGVRVRPRYPEGRRRDADKFAARAGLPGYQGRAGRPARIPEVTMNAKWTAAAILL